MSRVLDILEDYCLFRQYSTFFNLNSSLLSSLSPLAPFFMIETIFSAACAEYCFSDSDTTKIDEHNKPGSEKFIFYLTKHSSGLGIN
jgi:SWI/SNF-related matrix-associated actin-dependent regulator of chromatin subfamily A member 5